MPRRTQKVQLVRHSVEPEALTALGARLCYAGGDIEKLLHSIESKDQKAFVEKIMSMGHESVLEHVSFTFLIEGVSRVLLAQLTRHRIASFSVQSQRYVAEDGFEFILPPAIAANEEAKALYLETMDELSARYTKLTELLMEGTEGTTADKKKAIEDARFVLPNGCTTKMMVTMNARSLMNFFNLRCCNRAQWEIRELATQMLLLVREVCPTLFRYAGPPCLAGKCPEGKMTCGKMKEMKEKFLGE